ncbi:MAG: DinB family protein [Phycisphaerales bacterium]|nr:MAG: DinB family protein [Phycisphaerales bacterium]
MSEVQNSCELTVWLLERLFHPTEGWEHGSFLSLIGDLTSDQAQWRPAPDKRCIWELVIHMRSWRSFVNNRLRGEPVPDPFVPWPPLPEANDGGDRERLWAAEIESLKEIHNQLVEAAGNLDPAERHPHPDLKHLPHVIGPLGVQIHDSYHLGQIAMLRGMQGLPPVE